MSRRRRLTEGQLLGLDAAAHRLAARSPTLAAVFDRADDRERRHLAHLAMQHELSAGDLVHALHGRGRLRLAEAVAAARELIAQIREEAPPQIRKGRRRG
jgi:hypothetical protein